MKKQFLSVFALSVLLIASCGDSKKEEKKSETEPEKQETVAPVNEQAETPTTPTTPEAPAENFNLLVEKEKLANAEASLKDLPEFKGKDIKVFQTVHFYEDGRIKLAIQNPEKPDNIDDYQYKDGKWDAPQPVQISGGGKMSSNVFPLSQIKFENVATIYKTLEDQSKDIEGAKIDGHIYYNFNVSKQEGQWFSGIQGTRENFSGYFNADGSLKEFKKN